jgi:hypothetical protein
MDKFRRSSAEELERLRGELARVGQSLDELEQRRLARRGARTAGSLFSNTGGETRFASCIARGLAKLTLRQG